MVPPILNGPVGRLEDAVELQQQRALAGSVGTYDRHLFVASDSQVDTAEGFEAVRIVEVNMLEVDPPIELGGRLGRVIRHRGDDH